MSALESWGGEESEPQSEYEVWLFKKGEADPGSQSKYYLCFSLCCFSVCCPASPSADKLAAESYLEKKHIWRIYLWNSYMNLLRKAESRPVVIKSIALWYCITAKVILFCSSAKWKFLLQLIGGHRFCGITNSSGLLKTKAWSHISSICINTEFF